MPEPTPALTDELRTGEEEGDLDRGIFGRVRAMNRIRLDRFGEIAPDRAGRGLGRVRGAHHLAVAHDRALAFKDLDHHRAAGHEFDEIAVEWPGLMDLIKFFSLLASQT